MLFPTMPAPITTARADMGRSLMWSSPAPVRVGLPGGLRSGRQLIYQTDAGPATSHRAALRPRVRGPSRPAGVARDPSRRADRRGGADRPAGRGAYARTRGGPAPGAGTAGGRLPAPRHVRRDHQHHQLDRHYRRAGAARGARGRACGGAGRRRRPPRGRRPDREAGRGRVRPAAADRAGRGGAQVHLPLLPQSVPGAGPRSLPEHVAANLASHLGPAAAAGAADAGARRAVGCDPAGRSGAGARDRGGARAGVRRGDAGRAVTLQAAPGEWLGGCTLLLKREDGHELGAFKWRGALPAVEQYRTQGHASVVTASTGNHGAATAWATARNGMTAVVFVPQRASAAKLELLRGLGADLVVGGADLDEAKAAGIEHARSQGLPFFEDGAEPVQYDGYGGIADEILAEVTPDAVLVPVGNGALLAGIGLRLGVRSPATRRIGVVAAGAPVMARSFEGGHVVESSESDTFAAGIAVRVAIPVAVEALARAADEITEVTDREIAGAVGAFAAAGMRVEGSAAAALAAARRLDGRLEGVVVLIVTGRNIDDDLWQRAVKRPASFSG